MAKVFGIHEIELRPGVTAEQFERFLKTEYLAGAAPLPAGWTVAYLKGNRGEREGKYAVLIEIPSVEARDRFFPTSDQLGEEYQQWRQQLTAAQETLGEKMDTFTTGVGVIFTDYEVIAG